MSTGDLEGNLERLKDELRRTKYPEHLDEAGLRLGDFRAVLPIVRHSLLSFSRHVSEDLVSQGHELRGKSDSKFVELSFKALREHFGMKTVLTASQFQERGFAERKLMLLRDILHKCVNLHNEAVRLNRMAPTSQEQSQPSGAALSQQSLSATGTSKELHSSKSRDPRGSESLPHERTVSLPKAATPRKPSMKADELDLSRWDGWPNCSLGGAYRSRGDESDEATFTFASSKTGEYSRPSKEESQQDTVGANSLRAELAASEAKSQTHNPAAKSARPLTFSSTPRREQNFPALATHHKKEESHIEDLAQALQRVLHETPSGGQEIAAMLRGLADEVGGKVETPKSLFPDFPKATPLAASPSWATPLQKAPSVQAPLMPAPQESDSHKTDQGIAKQMTELLSQVERLRLSSEQCNVRMQTQIATLDAKVKATEDSQRSANAMLAAPYPPMPPYPILNPWQQQQLAMRPFQAYEPWSFPVFPATSKERSPSATLQDLTGADCKWEGYEKTEQMLKDIQGSYEGAQALLLQRGSKK